MEMNKERNNICSQVDVYLDTHKMFKEDRETIVMLMQKYLSVEFQGHVSVDELKETA